MERLQHSSARAYQELLAHQPMTPAKAAFAWQLAAGPALARAGRARWSPDGILRVQARDATWRLELRRARPVIAERLARLLGPEAVKKIVIE